MKKVLVVSNDVVGSRMAGPGIRAWELARALSRDADVSLAAPGAVDIESPVPVVPVDARGEALRAAALAADVVIVQGLVLAHYPFLSALDVPLVVDVYDPFVLENLEARAGQTASGRARHHATDLAALVGQLERGDFFLCASEAQRDFWLGMLTAVGRVNPATHDDDPALRRLIDVVPFGLPDAAPTAGRPVLKGVVPGIGAADRVILWAGGIWSWFDPLTLIRAVAEVAGERDDVRLFFLGTQTPSPFVPRMEVARRAAELADELGLTDRVVFFNPGWVPYAERAGYLLEADIGASCHLPHVETRFAYRTRLLDYFWAGLPMLVTEGDVLADVVAAEDLGRTVPPGDVPAVAGALRALLAEPAGRAGYAARFEGLRGAMTWSRVVEPLATFVAEPRRAADRPAGRAGQADSMATPWRALPARAAEVLGDGGPLLLAEEIVRYARWLRRPRG